MDHPRHHSQEPTGLPFVIWIVCGEVEYWSGLDVFRLCLSYLDTITEVLNGGSFCDGYDGLLHDIQISR